MLYNKEEHSRYVLIAGRISIAAAVVGFAVFLVAFLVDVGSQELSKVSAQTATTSLIVLNTPPEFAIAAYEVPDSATSTPVNTGDTMTWEALATDSNSAPYFLIICSDSATPTADVNDTGNGDGNGPPQCRTPDNPVDTGTAIQWGVSSPTASGVLATVSTTTASTAISQFEEVNEWYAWVCDDDFNNPRCSSVFYQGPTSTPGVASSPFHVNNRPNLVSVPTPASADPGGDIVFTTVSDDPDVVGGEDEILIVVCRDAGDYNPTTNDCDANFIASTTIPLLSNASATYTLAIPFRDDTYPVNVFLLDEHGHEATENPVLVTFDVNNVPPEVSGGSIVINGGSDLELTVPGGETTGFTLDFTISDNNSCVTAASTTDEIDGYQVSLFRSNLKSTSTCDGVTPGQYDPNDCYTTGVATSTWNLDCTPNTAACTDPSVLDIDFTCTFPLWFVADPTDVGTPVDFEQDAWSAGVAGIDDDADIGSMATATIERELLSFTAIDLLTAEIAYGSIEAGGDTGSTNASTTILSIGNTGVDQELFGAAMCSTFSPTTTCPVSPTSTIPASEQQYSAGTFSYGSGTPLATTTNELELDVLKTTSTTTPQQGTTYWGIAVPVTIQLSGEYRGLNTFIGVTAEPADWTP